MTEPDASPIEVGRQLQQRREDLDLTQQALAQRLGIAPRTVSAAERGLNQITKSRRSDWETELGLMPGTISRAYRDGTPIEVASGPPAGSPPDRPARDAETERRRFAKEVAAELAADLQSGLEEMIVRRLEEEDRRRRESE